MAETLIKLFAEIADEAKNIATLLAFVRTPYHTGYLVQLSYFYFVLFQWVCVYYFIDRVQKVVHLCRTGHVNKVLVSRDASDLKLRDKWLAEVQIFLARSEFLGSCNRFFARIYFVVVFLSDKHLHVGPRYDFWVCCCLFLEVA